MPPGSRDPPHETNSPRAIAAIINRSEASRSPPAAEILMVRQQLYHAVFQLPVLVISNNVIL